MARPLRVEFPRGLYHVTARGNERKPIYRDDQDRKRFLERLSATARRHRLIRAVRFQRSAISRKVKKLDGKRRRLSLG